MIFWCLIWIGLMIMKWKSYKLQKEVQKRRALKKKNRERKNEESRNLLSEESGDEV